MASCPKTIDCPQCHGKGVKTDGFGRSYKCSHCEGSGQVKCPVCHGKGYA